MHGVPGFGKIYEHRYFGDPRYVWTPYPQKSAHRTFIMFFYSVATRLLPRTSLALLEGAQTHSRQHHTFFGKKSETRSMDFHGLGKYTKIDVLVTQDMFETITQKFGSSYFSDVFSSVATQLLPRTSLALLESAQAYSRQHHTCFGEKSETRSMDFQGLGQNEDRRFGDTGCVENKSRKNMPSVKFHTFRRYCDTLVSYFWHLPALPNSVFVFISMQNVMSRRSNGIIFLHVCTVAWFACVPRCWQCVRSFWMLPWDSIWHHFS